AEARLSHTSRCGGGPSRSAQPGVELLLELAAAARRDDPLAELAVLDDADGRNFLDAEFLREVGSLIDRNPDELERVVVAPALEYLRGEALDAAAAAG